MMDPKPSKGRSVFGPAAVADVLGVKAESGIALHDQIVRGLPKTCLQRCVARVTNDPAEQMKVIFSVISPSTYRRRKRTLTLLEGDRAARMARVIATAFYIWNDEADARRFLTSPHPILEMKIPIELCRTEPGTDWVLETLWSLFHSVPEAGLPIA